MRSELCDEQRTTERPARAAEGRPGQSGEREREREWGESHNTCDAGDTGDNAAMWSHQVGLLNVCEENLIVLEIFQRIFSFCQTFS